MMNRTRSMQKIWRNSMEKLREIWEQKFRSEILKLSFYELC
jgi:hypothetical protein